jgi:hypothetical protein
MTGPKKIKKADPPTKAEKDEKYLTDLTTSAYENGKIHGQQEVYKVYVNFLKQRMIMHFENKDEEMAKELRELYFLTKEKIKE